MSDKKVAIREVSPRDGLQNETPATVEQRIELVNRLVDAGVKAIEVGSFVSPKVIPAMANTDEVFAGIDRKDTTTYWALVPNVKGAELALVANADALSITATASETYGQKNVGRSIDESIEECGKIAASVSGQVPIDAVISCSFGSPWEGDVDPETVADIAKRLQDVGANHITLADTTGMGTPRLVKALISAIGTDIGFHFHDTRGTALVNAVAALSAGVCTFDCSLGAIGGSPSAVDAGGNLGTEDLVHLLDDFGIETGIDLKALQDIEAHLEACIGHELNSRIALRGPRSARHER